MTDNSKIDKIQQQIQALKEQLKKEKSKQNARQRKIDTRKKILLGAMLMHWVDTGQFNETDLLKGLDKFLVRNIDRALFDLPQIPSATQPIKNNKTQTVNNTKTDNLSTPTEELKTQNKSSISNTDDKNKTRLSRLETPQTSQDDIEKEFNFYA